MDYFWAVMLVVASVLCWAANVFGLPGNWLILFFAAIYAHFGPDQGRMDIDWGSIAGLGALAVMGEVIEFLAGAVGAKRAGGSKRGALLALLGSMLGGIVGIFVGIPIPIVGQVVAAVLFAGLGALGGAILGERWKGRDMQESLRVGQAAFWSRLLGTLGKTLVGAVMLAVLVVALVI
jgi:uncharacterized protein